MMLTACSEPGCETFVLIGGRCTRHELRQARSVLATGRPFVATVGGGQVSADAIMRLAATESALQPALQTLRG